MNNKNSRVIKLGTCSVNVLLQVLVKYYAVEVLTVDYSYS